jgi:hypothetical protein
LARGARMTIIDEQHAVADEHFTADGHAGARIEETIWETLHMKVLTKIFAYPSGEAFNYPQVSLPIMAPSAMSVGVTARAT